MGGGRVGRGWRGEEEVGRQRRKKIIKFGNV